MRRLYLLIFLAAAAASIIGCGKPAPEQTQPTRQAQVPNPDGRSVEEILGQKTPQTNPPAPAYQITILIDETKDQILKRFGTPDHLFSEDDPQKKWSRLVWIYYRKPLADYTLEIDFSKPGEGKRSDRVHSISLRWRRDARNSEISREPAASLLPPELSSKPPTLVYGSHYGTGFEALMLIWYEGSRTYIASFLSLQDLRLYEQRNTMDIAKDRLISTYHLTANGQNWQQLKLLELHEYDWKVDPNRPPTITGFAVSLQHRITQ